MAALAILLTCIAVAWAGDLVRQLGLLFYTEQFLAVVLGLALLLVFVSVRATKRQRDDPGPAPWFDWLAGILGLACGAFIAVRFPVLSELMAAKPLDGLIVATIVLVLVIEGMRRTVGTVLTVLVIVFIGIALVGHLLPGTLSGRKTAWQQLFYFLTWDVGGILGTPMAIVSTIVTTFVLFGQALLKSGGSDFFTEISMALVGRYRGGQAKIAVTASGFFGSISGSAVSNVVTTGVITIPLMRDAGYKPEHAGAIEAVASTGGQLMPPVMGAAAFLMAEFLEISYAEVALAAVMPAILYYVSLFILADLQAARSGIEPIPASRIPRAWPVLRAGWHFPIPFAVLIAALFWFNYSAEEAALLATLVVLIAGFTIGYRGKRLILRDVVDALRETGLGILDIIMIGAAAGIVIGTLNISGVGFGLTLTLVQLGHGNIALLMLISAGVCIILGMGMPTVGVYLLLATLVAPSLVEVGIDPIAAHLFILYFGMMSMITPPVAIAAFAAATLTGADAMKTGFAAVRFGWFAYFVPFLFLLSPGLLLQGSIFGIVYAVVMSAFGIWLVSAGIIGFMARRLGIVMRLLLGLSGLAVLCPPKAFGGNLAVGLIALAIGIALCAREIMAVRGRLSLRKAT